MNPDTQFILDIEDELIVDNFAGGGGASTGIEMALGRHVDHAINHDKFALGMHRINHPQTVHHPEDVFAVNPVRLAAGYSSTHPRRPADADIDPRRVRRIGLGWFSPDCKHFSKAKGGKPLSKKIRGLPIVILRWARVRTRVIYMENVEEIQTWGPLIRMTKKGKRGMYPDPAHKGRTWKAFLSVLSTGIDPNHPDLDEMVQVLTDKRDPSNSVTREELIKGFGYELDYKEIRACIHGAGTIRKRLFLIARCDGMPIVWPEATHFAPDKLAEARKHIGRSAKPYVPIASCIDWDVPCHSIFLTKAEAKRRGINVKRPLARSTKKRIATGVDRYVLKAAKPFLVSLTHQGSDRVEAIDESMSTITGAHRGEKALVAPNLMRHFGKSVGQSVESPGPTTVCNGGGKSALINSKITPFLTEHANASNQRNVPVNKPGPTITAETKGGSWALVSGTIVGAGGPAYAGKPKALDKAMGTLTTENHSHLVSAHMIQKGHLKSNSKMIKGADEPMRCQTTRAEHGVVAANMVKLRGDADTHAPGSPATDPVGTISAAGQHHGVVAANIIRASGNKNDIGQKADESLRTLTTKEQFELVQSKLVAPNVVAYYGSDKDGQAIDVPARTATVAERFGLIESEVVHLGMTEEQIAGARQVAAFLREYGVQFEGEFATLMVDGIQYVIVDIGMRMLTARELFRAQGFSNGYIIDRAWLWDKKTKSIIEVKLTKEQQIRMCGNSVCPPVAEALVRANNPELCIRNRRTISVSARREVFA